MAKPLMNTLKEEDLNSFSDLEKEYLYKLYVEKLPKHLAVIMDGNGRWAKKRKLPRSMGHRYGMEALRGLVDACGKIGIEILTVFAFSTENWSRPQKEINFLMDLLVEYLEKEILSLNENNVKVIISGSIDVLSPAARDAIVAGLELTKENTGLIFNIALNYGGRDDIVRAAQGVSRLVKKNELQVEEITPAVFEKYLFTSGLPDPDLLIRTSGEKRLSNFLLWQLAYSEIVFIDTLWPDFEKQDLFNALLDFQQRQRRFGSLNGKDGE